MSFFNHPNISFLMFPQFEITPSQVRRNTTPYWENGRRMGGEWEEEKVEKRRAKRTA